MGKKQVNNKNKQGSRTRPMTRKERRRRKEIMRRRRMCTYSVIIIFIVVMVTTSGLNIFRKTVKGNDKSVVAEKKEIKDSTEKEIEEEKKKLLAQKRKLIEEQRNQIMIEADRLKQGYYIDEAIELFESGDILINEEVTNKIEEYKAYKESFVKYEGPIEHIFFHSLIVYPELAFDNIGHDANGYNMWFTTVDEFKNMLPLLKENGYVVMDITEIFKKNDTGVMEKKDIYLPEGKKPLIISQDDVNYYDYMSPDGFAGRLVLDENNEVSTLVRNLDGQETITRDGDIVPILDDYIKENPDFSYRGAKGILAVTGYEGVLGYRLDSEK